MLRQNRRGRLSGSRGRTPSSGPDFVDDLPSKSEIFVWWKSRLRGLGCRINWGEPACWACGFHYGTIYDVRWSEAGWDKVLNCWDRIPLQRCHIVPRGLGGTNDVSNLFLMCRECHDLAPNTSFVELFLEWARAQNWDARELAKITSAMDAFGIRDAARQELCAVMISEGFRSWAFDRFGLHRPQSNYAPISSRLTPSTQVGLAVYYWRSAQIS
jgi:hypothetical protein